MSTSTKVGLGILVGLAVYLVYRMFEGYGQAPATSPNVTASNLQSAGAPDAPQGSPYTVPPAAPTPTLSDPSTWLVKPSTGPAVQPRTGRGRF